MAERRIPGWRLKDEVLPFVMQASKRVKSQANWVNGRWADFDGSRTSFLPGEKTFRIMGLFNQTNKSYRVKVIMNGARNTVVDSIEVARGSDTPPSMEQVFEKLIKEINRLIKPNGGGDKGAGGRSGNTVSNVNFSDGGGSASTMPLIHGLMHSQRILFQEHSWIQHTFELFDSMALSFARTFDMVNSCCSTALAALKAVPLETWMLIGAAIGSAAFAASIAPFVGELLATNVGELLTTYELLTTNVSGFFTTLLATQEAATIASAATAGVIQKLMELEIPKEVWEGLFEGLIESVTDVSRLLTQ